MTLQGWQGPLPPPEALREFEDAFPGAAQDIIGEFKAEAIHRRALEDREARLRVGQTYLGQVSALIFGLCALAVAAFAALHNAQWVGGIVGGGVIVSGMLALLRGQQRPENVQKPETRQPKR